MRYLAVLALTLSACAADPVQWDSEPSHPALAPLIIPTLDIAAVCGPYATACVVRHPELGACFIYAPLDARGELLDHERKHCAGWGHAPYTPTPQWALNVRR